MNKLIIALSVACASACVFAADNAIPKVTSNGWFTVASGNETGGSFNKTGLYDGSKYVIDSELESPVTFTASEKTPGKDMTEVSFTLDTSIVPADARKDLSTKGKVAFAASEVSGDTKAYFAWLGVENDDNGWVQLAGPAVKGDNESYKLDVTFDNREGSKKVQFKVDGTALTANDVDWLNYASPVSATSVAIDFVGSGNVASFAGNQQIVQAIIVVDDDVSITIKDEDVKKFDLKGKTPAEFFASEAKGNVTGFNAEGIKVATAYALGLIVDKEGTMTAVDGGYLTASAVAESDDTAYITFAMNVTPRASADTGVIVSYQVVNETDGGDPTPGLTIPKPGAGLTKYKVQATLSNAAPAAE